MKTIIEETLLKFILVNNWKTLKIMMIFSVIVAVAFIKNMEQVLSMLFSDIIRTKKKFILPVR
jgi:hypothetical protein